MRYRLCASVIVKGSHQFVNGVLWVLRSGARWHDLPERYGHYKRMHTPGLCAGRGLVCGSASSPTW